MRPLIHIGYHKTATTWMQNQLFVPAHGYQQLAGHAEIFDHVLAPHGLRFDPKPMQELLATVPREEGCVPVLSSEILSGHPFFGGRESEVYAARLKAIAPEARILVSIRAQHRILPSVYMQYLLRGGTMPYPRFFRDENDLGYFEFSSDHFDYDRLVAHYQQLFGAENVYVITQESLKSDRDATLQNLADFCENRLYDGLKPAAHTPHTPSYPEYAVPVLRRINHIQHSTLNPSPVISLGESPAGLYRGIGYLLKRPAVRAIFGKRKPVSEFVKARFTGRYGASNARLAKIVTHPLDLSGYEITPTD